MLLAGRLRWAAVLPILANAHGVCDATPSRTDNM
jgi:hypothetical protein